MRKTFTLAALGLCGHGVAWAHGGFGEETSLWSGALHLLTSPLSLAAGAGLVAALQGTAERLAYPAALLAGLAACAAAAQAPFAPTWLPALLLVLIAACAVAGWTPPAPAALLLAALAGLAAGVAAGLDVPNWSAAAGAGLTLLVLVNGALALLRYIAHWPTVAAVLPIARRVLGAWVAAIGLLMAALAWRGL